MTLLRRFGVFAIVVSFALPMMAQTFRGGIAGTVADSTGAVVPAATVKILNNATGLTREQTSTASGDFSFPDLPPGLYKVTVGKAGFQNAQLDNVEVAVGKIASLPVTLGVAAQTQTVEVQAAAVQLEANSSALNQVVNTRAVQEIPLNGRDFRQLLYLSSGYNQSNSMNGNRANQNNWQIDGTDNNDFWHNSEAVNQGSISGLPGVTLPIESIDQFNQQAGGGADFGRNPGSMVNVVVKSGTNAFHGTGYYYNRNEYFAESSPFSPAGSKVKLRNEQYGFSLGGPVIKNHTFFFINWEKQKYVIGNQISATVPSDAWISAATAEMQKFNIAVNPVMRATYQNLWPAKSHGAPATTSNYFSSDDNFGKSHNGIAKIDQNFGSNNTLSLRAFMGTGEAAQYAGGSVFRDYYQVVPSRQHNFDAIWTSVISARLVNQVLTGVNYFAQTFNDQNTGFNPPSWGFNTGVTNPSDFGSPNFTISGFDNGMVGQTDQLGRIDITGHVTDNLSYNFGPHALKFGAEYRRARVDGFYRRQTRGAFTFDGSQGPWAGDKSASDQIKSLSDFLAGYLPPGAGQIATGDPQRVYYVSSFEWWAQDNWQVNPHLNLNLGLRYTYNGRFHADDISIFDPRKPGGLGILGQNLDALYPADYNNFAPRFGFAYTPKRGGKLVVRGAYGIYYDIINANLFVDNRAGSDAGRGVSRNPGGTRAVYVINNPNAVTITQGAYIFGSAIPQPPFTAYTVSQDLRSPYVQNFNLNVQYQLTRNTLFQIGYVGNQARKLPYTHNINQPLPAATTAISAQARRPYNALFPQFSGITELSDEANSHYNALQTSFRTNSWHGLSSQFQYTFGHALDEQSTPRNNRPTDNYNLARDYSNANFDYRHLFSGYIIYEVPQLGHSMPRLTKGWQLNSYITYDSGNPFDLTVSPDISNTRNRFDHPVEIGDPYAGIVQPPTVNGRYVNGIIWYNPAAFRNPDPGTFGTFKRNTLYAPDFKSFDFSIFKNTPITERVSTQFRVEIFNLFNALNLGNPNQGNPSATLSGGGLILGTRNGGSAPGIGFGEPRNVQFALKVIF